MTMTPHLLRGPKRRHARGASLVVVMLVLLVVTVLGIAGARLALMGEMSARHDRDTQIAFEAAEAALGDAERDIDQEGNTAACASLRPAGLFPPDQSSLPVGTCYTVGAHRGVCGSAAPGTKPTWASVNFQDTNPTAPTIAFGTFTCRTFDVGSGIRPAKLPRYVIEILPDKSPGEQASLMQGGSVPEPLYRITAMGFGPREDIVAVVQSEYRRKKSK